MGYYLSTKSGREIDYAATKTTAKEKAGKYLKNKRPGTVVFVNKESFHAVKSKSKAKAGKNKGKHPIKFFV